MGRSPRPVLAWVPGTEMAIEVIGMDRRKIPSANEAAILQLRQRYLAAKEKTSRWHSIIRECYDYCIPNRNNVNLQDRSGQERMQKVVDGTAVEAIYGFANELQKSLIPPGNPWVKMVPGIATKEEDFGEASDSLDFWTSIIFEDIRNSNFDSAIHETLLDIGVGIGAIRVVGGDAKQRLIYESIPMPQIVIEEGPYGSIENVYRPIAVRAEHIKRRWPLANLDSDIEDLVKTNPQAIVDFVECSVFDTTYQCYRNVVFSEKSGKAIQQTAAEESEYAVSRWSVAPGEFFGRGVAMSALPFIRTLNRATRLTISISELAITGMYMGVGDGVFNPHNVVFKPGAIFPVEDGDAGLKPIAQSHDFQISRELMMEWRERIRSIMFQDSPAELAAGAGRSATEALIRADRLQQKIGGSFPRLFRELVSPIFKKTVFQLQLLGRLPKDIRINGHDIDIQYVGPLAQISRMEEVKAVQSSVETVAGLLGPEMVHAAFKTEDIPRFIAQGFGAPNRLVRTPKEVKDTLTAAMNAAKGQVPGGDPSQPSDQLGGEAMTGPPPAESAPPLPPPGMGQMG